MIVAHLIGGNEIAGLRKGDVIVNGITLQANYEVLADICGNIPLGDLDYGSNDITRDYIKLVKEYDGNIDAEDFVRSNYLTASVSYSSYELDTDNNKLTLSIETY